MRHSFQKRLANQCLLMAALGAVLGGCRFDTSGVSLGDQPRSREQASDRRSGAERAATDRLIVVDRPPAPNCATKFGSIPGFIACGELWTDGLQRCWFQYTSPTAKSCDEACLNWRCVDAYGDPNACSSTMFRACKSPGTSGLCTCESH